MENQYIYIANFRGDGRNQQLLLTAPNPTDAETMARRLVNETGRSDWKFDGIAPKPILGYFIEDVHFVPVPEPEKLREATA